MNEESQVIFLEYFFKGLQKEANLSIPESIGVAIWFADQNYLLTKKAEDAPAPVAPVMSGLEKSWNSLKNFGKNLYTKGPVDVGKNLVGRFADRIGHTGAKDVINQSGMSGIGDFLKGIAPYAVPGILGYLALKATGAESGTAALGGLAAGAIGGSFWKDPANAETVGDIKNWGKNLITPAAVPPPATLTPEQAAAAAAAAAKTTADTSGAASKQLTPPPK